MVCKLLCHGSSICPEQHRDSIDLQPLLCCGSDLENLVGAELVIHALILLIFLVTLEDSGGERETFTDLDIKTSGTGCVKIQKIECDNCKIETEKGTSVLQSIKSHKIDIRTNGGKVIGLGTLYGNTDIHATEKGSVNIEKLQGSSINISTEDGLLKTKYLYAESSSLSSVAGDILLGSIHGNTSLQTKTGSITVDSSDGSLKASTHHGAIDVYVSQLRKVDLTSQKGSITVKVPASLKAYLQLSGRKVDVSSEIQLKETQSASKDDHVTISGHMNQKNETDKWIKADTQNGKVYLKSQSWIQSVKLKNS
ncbi:protein FAM185A [Antrostomus carolinensis]|uniref:protein FAM185A n=1 Tax=Antrostomus carolinensis TaxID=279965 RepID=UPI000528B4B1|nr:protein FAM185A [Antrostomus carolinensis]